MKTNIDLGLLLIRLVAGITMLFYGVDKIMNGTGFIEVLLDRYHLPLLLQHGVILGEVLAPVLIIIGFRARLAGLILSFNCMVAICLSEFNKVFQLNEFGGWAIDQIFMYFTIGLALYFTGAGKIAISISNRWD